MHFFFSSHVADEPFLTEINELENEVRTECTMEKLKAVMDLYKIAIEHYGIQDVLKVKEFQARMKSLLSLPNVKNILISSNPVRNSRRSFEPYRDLSTERTISKVLIHHSSENKFAIEIAQNDLKIQNDLLNARVLKRRKSSQGFGIFEKEVEKIIEKFVEEKEKLLNTGQATKQEIFQLDLKKKLEIQKLRRQILDI